MNRDQLLSSGVMTRDTRLSSDSRRISSSLCNFFHARQLQRDFERPKISSSRYQTFCRFIAKTIHNKALIRKESGNKCYQSTGVRCEILPSIDVGPRVQQSAAVHQWRLLLDICQRRSRGFLTTAVQQSDPKLDVYDESALARTVSYDGFADRGQMTSPTDESERAIPPLASFAETHHAGWLTKSAEDQP